MKLRPPHLLACALAAVSIAAGVLILRYMPAAQEPVAQVTVGGTASLRSSLQPPVWVALRPLRDHAAHEAAPEPPVQEEVMASLSFESPSPPPRRPADLAQASPEAPLPPRRPPEFGAAPPEPTPKEVAATGPALEAPSKAPESAPAALEAFLPPLPPPRPSSLPASAAVVDQPPAEGQPAAAAPPATQVAKAVEPVLRAAPDDAFSHEEAAPRFGMGAAVYVRIFKQEGELELWLKRGDRFALYHTYPICKWSGRLGPKIKEADYQSPEGFYSVSARQLNPNSHYHRAFNVGYPNAFDKQNGRTGGLVMVHGACKSVGCFAMTDQGIDEIYNFVAAAVAGGQAEVPVHIFPFRLTDSAIARETGGGQFLAFMAGGGSYGQWASFWRNLKEGYDLFEQTGVPPTAYACGDHYAFGTAGASCRRIAGW